MVYGKEERGRLENVYREEGRRLGTWSMGRRREGGWDMSMGRKKAAWEHGLWEEGGKQTFSGVSAAVGVSVVVCRRRRWQRRRCQRRSWQTPHRPGSVSASPALQGGWWRVF